MENNPILDKEIFLNKYHLKECFESSQLSWDTLEDIYRNYLNLQQSEKFKNICRDFEDYCRNNINPSVPIHSIRCRSKDPEHVIEKIIRKRGKELNHKYKDIDSTNYAEIIRDLIGLRILVIKKEDWECVFDALVAAFPNSQNQQDMYIAEEPVAYIRYGDRDIFNDKIHKEYSNKGYRSQHYIVKFKGYFCEIQVRTLAEEVYGEFDHMVKYPYRNDNHFLIRYTNTLSKLTDSIDEIMSTCLQINETGWVYCSQYFDEDKYLDWKKTSQRVCQKIPECDSESASSTSSVNSAINVRAYANNILYRKGN